MGGYEDEVIAKFLEDKRTFSRPSVSSFMILNLDKTHMTEQIADTIVTVILESEKPFRKIVFVGVKAHWRNQFGIIKQKGIIETELDGIVGMNTGIFNNPFISWGRYRKKNQRYELPISFQFHHTQMDGSHAGRFLENLQKEITVL